MTCSVVQLTTFRSHMLQLSKNEVQQSASSMLTVLGIVGMLFLSAMSAFALHHSCVHSCKRLDCGTVLHDKTQHAV